MDSNDTLAARIAEVLKTEHSGEIATLQERLEQNEAQLHALRMEDRDWLSVLGGNGERDENDGLSLDKLKEWSQVLREAVAASPLPKQANALRYSYTFSQPFIIPDLKERPEKRPGRPAAKPDLSTFYHNKTNQRYVFGKNAQELISTACSTDSAYFALGDDSTRTVRPVPLYQIIAVSENPDFPGEVWAYLREWNQMAANGKSEVVRRWYYTDQYGGKRRDSLPSAGFGTNDTIPVDGSKTMIDFVVNQQVGWTFGAPDLMAGHTWNRKYVTMMNHGEEVSSALAYFAYVVKQKSNKGASNVGIKMGAGPGRAGNTAVIGEGNEMGALSSSRSAYDFAGLRDIAGVYALSVGVSVVDLLASPAASGSSYGSAAALAPAMRRGIESRRSQVASFFERIIEWGTGEPISITPAAIEEVEPHRKAQMILMAWNSGLVHADEVRSEMMWLTGLTSKHTSAPEGVLIPNNEKSLARKDIDTDAPAPEGGTGVNPGQGQSTGSGTGSDSATSNDERTDLVQ